MGPCGTATPTATVAERQLAGGWLVATGTELDNLKWALGTCSSTAETNQVKKGQDGWLFSRQPLAALTSLVQARLLR